MLAKLPGLDADAFVVDLEDGVAPADKEAARQHVRQAFTDGLLPEGRWMLRLNGIGTRWHRDDLKLVAELVPPAALLPKAEDPDEVGQLARGWARDGTATALMIETARGVDRVGQMARVHPDVSILIYGSADLRRSFGARPDTDRRWEQYALSRILLAARAHGCLAVDAVFFRFRDQVGLEAEAAIARDMGFDGKCCIHPSQIDVIHRVFSSSAEEIDWARKVQKTWRAGDGDRTGVVVMDGEMLEALHLDVARRILDRAPDEPD